MARVLRKNEMKYKVLEGRPEKKLATINKALVVEGFPRSGNTFLSDFLLVTQSPSFRFAHHTHLIENVMLGIDNNLPAVVIMRNPLDAIASFVIYSEKSVEFAIDKWLRFYAEAERLDSRALLVSFETITANPVRIIEELNAKFQINLDVPSSESAAMAATKDRIEVRSKNMANREDESRRKDIIKTSCLPVEGRNLLKASIVESVQSKLTRQPEVEELYFRLMNRVI